MEWKCCDRCQVFWSCDTKWYRGERGEVSTCCPICDYFADCFEKAQEDSDEDED